MDKKLTGAEIRQSFIDFFKERGHEFVPSSSVVPGGDSTLLFTNAGMVQFKDVFLGEDERSYHRAVNSQKCMRVAGKHNDLDEVGRDDTHHTFFEMLGNWSFGDYYKKEAIAWAWELLTQVWGVDGNRLWTTTFKDEYDQIPADVEAFEEWKKQPGFDPTHVVHGGRKDNFWEMADTGPCGPSSEIHIDLGPDACDMKGVPGHVCEVNGDCKRFTELWNLVFMQYNRLGPDHLVPLPKTHVDTGMGFERIVSVLQKVQSNYQIDLFRNTMDRIQALCGQSDEERKNNITPYRVIADHVRASSFLIADGVVPGNTGRNYICRMIIRRASRFGSKLNLNEPFLARVAEEIINDYGGFYTELEKNRETILDNLTREEIRFHRTLESGIGQLDVLVEALERDGKKVLAGSDAFELYATHGLPLELTRDILREKGYEVEEAGFRESMEEHRIASGAGKAFGALGGDDVELYRGIVDSLIADKQLPETGVAYDPYGSMVLDGTLLSIILDGEPFDTAHAGEQVNVIVPKTSFYIESGGQLVDHGEIRALDGQWAIKIDNVRRPAAGAIIHSGTVLFGMPKVGDSCKLVVNDARRWNIMRNHTATHLLHAELQKLLGVHVRQAGSMVSPDRLRFDFTHPEAMTEEEIRTVEDRVNQAILGNYPVDIAVKSRDEAIAEGAMALFGEKYGQEVRTVAIHGEKVTSYELCGGTHVPNTGLIGTFLITSESSAAAGVRRIEAVTGQRALELIQKRFELMRGTASLLETSMDEVLSKTELVLRNLTESERESADLRQKLVSTEFEKSFDHVPEVSGIPVLAVVLPDADMDTLRKMADRFRDQFQRGVVVLGSVSNGKPVLIAAVTDALVKEGFHAGKLIKEVAQVVGGNGGGRPNLAQAGGRDADQLEKAISSVPGFVRAQIS